MGELSFGEVKTPQKEIPVPVSPIITPSKPGGFSGEEGPENPPSSGGAGNNSMSFFFKSENVFF
jgi:hypothetical protein